MQFTDLALELETQKVGAIESHPRQRRQQAAALVDSLFGIFFVKGTDIASELAAIYEFLAKAIGRDKTLPIFSLLPSIKAALIEDIQAAFDGDPAAKTLEEVVESYPTISALIHHRLAHAIYQVGESRLARMISEISHSQTGIDIHPGAKIGPGCFIDHGTGVVIGETAVVGRHVRIYQGVTLGAKGFRKGEDGKLVKTDPRHPIVEDHVVIYAHATVLGRVTIGKGAVIGGNVWVTSDVSPGMRVLQMKADRQLFRGHGDGI